MSDAWLSAFKERLAASETFKKGAKSFRGSMAFALLPEADKGVEPRGMVLDLADGALRKGEIIQGPGPYEADYVIRGTGPNWKKLLSKEIFPVPAIMGGQLQLVKGNAMGLMTQMGSLQSLLDEAGAVPTAYPA